MAMLLHPFTCDQSGFYGGEVYFFRVDVWLHSANKFPGEGGISGRVAQLDQRLLLPVMRDCLVVAQSLGHADCQFPFPTLGAKAQINSKWSSFASGAGENFCNLLGEPDKEFTVRNRRFGRFVAVAEDVHQIHIRAVIEFVAAEFSQGEDGERGIYKPAFGIEMLGLAMAALKPALGFAQSVFDKDICQS